MLSLALALCTASANPSMGLALLGSLARGIGNQTMGPANGSGPILPYQVTFPRIWLDIIFTRALGPAVSPSVLAGVLT